MSKTKTNSEFYTPPLPKFLVSRATNMSVSLIELDRNELIKIGRDWTAALLNKAGVKDVNPAPQKTVPTTFKIKELKV